MSTEQIYDKWYLMPALTDRNGIKRPKYVNTDGIKHFSGTLTTPDVVSDHYPALTKTHSDVDKWYIVRLYGNEDKGLSALNDIHNYSDTRTLTDKEGDVAPIFNSHFSNLEQSGKKLAESFKVGDT